MEEARRLHCLRVLGIECFLPRRQLPGAREHAVYEGPALPSPEERAVQRREPPPAEEQAVQRRELPSPEGQAVQRREPPSPEGQAVQRREPPSTEERAVQRREPPSAEGRSARRPEPSPPPAFTLALAAVGATLVVDGLPSGQKPPAKWPKFLHSLLSVCLPAGEVPPEDEMKTFPLVHWPPKLQGAGAGRSEEAIRDYLAVKLKKVLSGGNSRRLLLMGETAARFAAPSPLSPDLVVTKCSSAAAAMTDGALKAKLWQELRSLRGQVL